MTLVICPELMRKYLWWVGVNRPLKRVPGGQWPKKFEKHCTKVMVVLSRCQPCTDSKYEGVTIITKCDDQILVPSTPTLTNMLLLWNGMKVIMLWLILLLMSTYFMRRAIAGSDMIRYCDLCWNRHKPFICRYEYLAWFPGHNWPNN